jgi:prolyl-tRNA synthetase
MSKGIISKDEDYSQWFNDLVVKADLAEHSAVRGCMVIKPYGYSIWEKMQAVSYPNLSSRKRQATLMVLPKSVRL